MRKIFVLLITLYVAGGTRSYGLNYNNFSLTPSLTYALLEDAGVEKSHVHNDWSFIATLGYRYINTPLLVNTRSSGGSISESLPLLEQMSSYQFGAGYYLTPRFMFQFSGAYSEFMPRSAEKVSGLNDVRVAAKWILFNKENFAFAFMPFVSIPTKKGAFKLQNLGANLSHLDGTEGSALSDDGPGYGGQLIFEYVFSRLQVVANIGYRYAQKAYLDSPSGRRLVDIKNQVQLGAGVYLPLLENLGLNFEYLRFWNPNSSFYSVNSPSELHIGLSAALTRSLHLFVGAGVGSFDVGDSENEYQATVGLKFAPQFSQKKKDLPPSPKKMLTLFGTEPFNNGVEKKGECLDKIFGKTNTAVFRFPRNAYSAGIRYQKIDEVLDRIKLNRSEIEKVYILGHASQVGDESHNVRLSQKRAGAILNYALHYTKLPQKLFSLRGVGSSMPIDPSQTEQAHIKNRRVELSVLSKKEACFK